MRISNIIPSVLLVNGLHQVISFQTTTIHSGSKLLPQASTNTKAYTTLIHRSPSIVVARATSNEEEETIAPSPASSPESSAENDLPSNDEANAADNADKTYVSQSPPQAQQGPSMDDLMLMMGTNPRRIFLSLSSATGIALAGNLFGVTSNLLTTIPEETVEASGLDTYFPRGDYKRCRTSEYTFVIPREWVADTFVELAKAQRKIQPLDYSMQPTKKQMVTLPDAAYGPPGRLNQKGVSQAGDTNVSVIVSSGLTGFTLQGTLGTPKEAAETLLSKSIAPEGSGRTATLLRAVQTTSGYQFEYIVDRGSRGPPLRNIAVVAAAPSGDKLYTLTVVAPAERFDENDTKLRKIADSFHLR